jgi:undecaprenyl-diphosphatase
MSIFEAIILGIVEGLTEFLPVSSTGHLILTAELLGLQVTNFLTTFEVVIQLGAILAVVTLYWRKFLLDFKMNKKLVVALIPSLIIGGFFYPFIKSLFDKPGVVVASLFLGGIAILVIEYLVGRRKESDIFIENVEEVSLRMALYIGLFQALAVVPGVSRAGATIMGGLILGFRRKAIVEFSFLLAVPTMMAASAKDLFESGGSLGSQDFTLLAVGFVTAYLAALLAIKLFLQFVQTNTFKPFGWYRIVVAGIFFFFIL